MKYIFLVFYIAFVFLMFSSFFKLINHGKKKEAIVGTFMAFIIVPDFLILDAYGIPGSFIVVFFFICLLPIGKMIFEGKIKVEIISKDTLFVIMLVMTLGFALYTKFIYGVTTDFFENKLFGYIYSLLIPMIVIMYYKDYIIESYDVWKPILLYAIMAYAFKNFSLVGVLGFRDVYLAKYEELRNVIFAAQVLAIGAIMCLYDLNRKYELNKLFFLVILFLQILLFESRGPLISVSCGIIIIWWNRLGKGKIVKRINKKLMLSIPFFIVVLVVGLKFLLNSGNIERLISKAKMFSSGDIHETRYLLYPIIIKAIKEHFPFGVGFGNSKIAIMQINSYFYNDYPHNLVMEMLLEEGIFISIPFFYLFIKWMRSILIKDKYITHTLLFFTLYIFAFICSMVSGDIVGNRLVFVFGYLAYHSRLVADKSNILDINIKRLRSYR